MGGAVSSGENNDELVDNLLEADYIKTPLIERVFRSVDRKFYYTKPYKLNAYKDLAWRDKNLHMSAPCIYSEVMESLQLEPGMSFLNIGSGTGYLSTLSGLILGSRGVNHGIELYSDVVEYANDKLKIFMMSSFAIDLFDFCPPEFVTGNCLDANLPNCRYDRVYCGAACPQDQIQTIIDLLKVGGICVVPVNNSLVRVLKVSEAKVEMKNLLPVSFANLIVTAKDQQKKSVSLPEWSPPKLSELCRDEIRSIIRKNLKQFLPGTKKETGEDAKTKKKRRQERCRANRLLVVQRRSPLTDSDENAGYVAIAYSVGNSNSSDDTDPELRNPEIERSPQEPASPEEPSNPLEVNEANEETNDGNEGPSENPFIPPFENEGEGDDSGAGSLAEGEAANREGSLSNEGRAESFIGRLRNFMRSRPGASRRRGRDPRPTNEQDFDDFQWSDIDESESAATTSASNSTSSSSDNSRHSRSRGQRGRISGRNRSPYAERNRRRPRPRIAFSQRANVELSNGHSEDLMSESEKESACEETFEEELEQRMAEMMHPFSIKLRENIQKLPLPPPLKVFVNYNRKLD